MRAHLQSIQQAFLPTGLCSELWFTECMTWSEDFWDMHFADWVSLLPAVIAVYAVFSAWRARPASLMARRRNAAMKGLNIPRKSSLSRVQAIVKGAPQGAADELNWLASVYPSYRLDPDADVKSSNLLNFSEDRAHLAALSRAYRAYAADLRRGSLLGAAAAPVVIQEIRIATLTADLLAEAASGKSMATSESIRVETPKFKRILEISKLPELASGTLAYDLFVSYRRHRLVPLPRERPVQAESPQSLENPGLEKFPLSASAEDLSLLERKLAKQHAFDGVLPRLLDWRTERDETNGRVRLHLALSETTFGAVTLDHYPAAFKDLKGELRNVKGDSAKLLTLSSAVVTADRVLLFAGRSKLVGSHPNQFGPAVNGNLELRTRKGVLPDGDEFGLPDPRRALAREAAEELGLGLGPSAFQILGIGKFTIGEVEHGTNVLMALAQVEKTADQIREGVREADPMEGRWELGSHLLAAALPSNDSDVDVMLSWLLHDPRLTPHSVLVGCVTLARFFTVDAARIQKAAASQTGTWATEVLALSS
jgi:hypothetical protein